MPATHFPRVTDEAADAANKESTTAPPARQARHAAADMAAYPDSGAAGRRRATDAATEVHGNVHANAPASIPTCIYPLDPPKGATVQPGVPFMGRELRGTRAYERFVHTLMTPRKTGKTPGLDRPSAQTVVDNAPIKPGTRLLAPCHEGYTRQDRWPHSDAGAVKA
jgi:hypothetical protein